MIEWPPFWQRGFGNRLRISNLCVYVCMFACMSKVRKEVVHTERKEYTKYASPHTLWLQCLVMPDESGAELCVFFLCTGRYLDHTLSKTQQQQEEGNHHRTQDGEVTQERQEERKRWLISVTGQRCPKHYGSRSSKEFINRARGVHKRRKPDTGRRRRGTHENS